MKALSTLIFSLFLFLFLSLTGQAQITTTFTYADGYNACGQSDLKITLTNTSSDSIVPIIAEFKLNNAMGPISHYGTSLQPNQHIISASGNTLLIVFKKALTANSSFDIYVRMNSNKSCQQIGCGQFFSTTDSLTLTYSNKDFYFYNNNVLSSPCLTYNETLFTNRLVSAFLGDTITRKIVLTNTGGGKFDGYLQLKDQFGEFVEIESIYSTNPGYTLVSAGETNDSTYIFKGRFPNIPNGDSIVIYEKVIVRKCIKEDEGKSSIFIDWSCNTALCNQVTPYPIIAQILKNKKKPEVVITKTSVAESNCMGSKTRYIYTVKNRGARPATNLVFSMHAENTDTYTYISKNSLKLSDTTGMVLQSNNKTTLVPLYTQNPRLHTFDHSCTIPDPLLEWRFQFESLMPGDSFFVESEGTHCCPGSDTSNVELTFESWGLQVAYKDECKEQDFTASSNLEAENILSFQQFYEPIITDMHGLDTARFEIFNNGLTTNFYRINEDQASFKIRIKLDTGLVYVPHTLKMVSEYGFVMTPQSEQFLPGAGVDGYIDDFLEATFAFPDTFKLDPLFYARFMRNSSVFFDLAAVCPARMPDSRFTQEFFIVPDGSCSPGCEILLSSYSTRISVHCPGCITPGWVGTSHKAIRLNIGEQDNDNNRLPDQLTYKAADRAKIKNNRCIPGDTLQTEFVAYFQDGDPFVGKSTAQLENNGTKSFKFNYTYLKSAITMGKLFQLNHVKVFITDIDHAAITAGIDSIILPLSCVTKIPEVNDSIPGAVFFFDLSLDTLYKYGIDPAYEYDPGDGLKVVCNYTILEPSSFYLSNPQRTTDPWYQYENAPIILNAFNNTAYLTGSRNTAADHIRVEAGDAIEIDPSSLDSTMSYWCEGYGSASTIVGKRREIAFSIPDKVQCKERAFFYVKVNPSGGIFKNAFPFEYRNFISIDSIHATVPAGYKFVDWTITNTVNKPDGFLEYELCTYVDSLKNINERGPNISIPLQSRYSRATDFGTDVCLDHLTYGDEFITTTISYYIQPDCDLPETEITYPSPVFYYKIGPNQIPYADQAVEEKCIPNSNICKFEPLVPKVTKLNAGLKVSPVTNEIQLSQQNFCYPINIEENKGSNAGYTFLKVRSLNNKVKPEKLTNKETHQVYYPDASGLFHLDTTLSKAVYEYELCFSNICSELIEKDTVRLIYGHDCFEYPDSVYSNVCKIDSLEHYVFPGTLQIGGTIFGPAEIKMCEPFEVSTIYNITGIGGVDNMLVKINKDSTSLLSATMSINDSAPVDVFSTLDTNTTLSLKQKILAVKSDGLKAGDKVKIVLKFNTDCQYKGGLISEQATIVTSACDTLYGNVLTISSPTLIGFPKPDTKTIQSTYGELKNLGGKAEVTINAYNSAVTATQNKTRVTLILPAGFTYANMVTGNAPSKTTDTSLIWDLPAGIPAASAKTLQPLLNYTTLTCDSVTFHYLLSDLSVGCASQPCVQRDTAYTFKAPVKCYPCPAEVTLSERCKELPVFNIISWAYPITNYCPDDQNFIYKLYFSKTSNGTYTLLDSTHSKTYTHDSLEVYDGCYYVTVTDLQQGLTTKSNVACKATCREQFQCGDLFIPNLLTPNKDGNNDTFEITGAYTTLKVEIYNSWGSTVFKSDNYKNEWDAKGLTDGVYYYHVYIDGSDQKCLGWIHVLGGK
jgi:gliding motility-associated-like protein